MLHMFSQLLYPLAGSALPPAAASLSPASTAAPPVRSSRDLRLDFWRGLCIVDMVLVHMLDYGLGTSVLTETLLREYTRFAAGGFVFVAGLCVGAIHLPKAHDPQRRAGVYFGLLRRAGFILLVHYLAMLSYMVICPLNGQRVEVARTLRDIVLFQQGYDLLPFYVCMVAVCPLLLELMRRRLWWLIVAASASLFAVGSRNPWIISLPIQQHFFPSLWQLIFVMGLFAGASLSRYDRMRPLARLRIACAVWVVSAALVLAAHAAHLGMAPSWLSFEKVPLSLGEALRYVALTLSLMLASDLLWSRIEPSVLRHWVNRLGRRSLGLAVLHIWIVGWAVDLSVHLPRMDLIAIVCMALALAGLWLVTWMLDAAARKWRDLHPQWPRLEYVGAPAVIGLILVFLVVANPAAPRPQPSGAPLQLALTSPLDGQSGDAGEADWEGLDLPLFDPRFHDCALLAPQAGSSAIMLP